MTSQDPSNFKHSIQNQLLNNALNTLREASSLKKLEVNISRSKYLDFCIFSNTHQTLHVAVMKAFSRMKFAQSKFNIQALLLNLL